MASQILKYVDFTKTQKSRYRKNGTLFFLQIKKNRQSHIKGYFMAKNNFVAQLTFKEKGTLLFDYFFIYIEKNSIFTTEGKLP